MITVIHGDNAVASRKKLIDLRSNFENHEMYDGKKDSVEKIKNELSSQSLFSKNREVIIENIKSLGLKSYNDLIKSINKYENDKSVHIIIYLETTEKASFLKKFKTSSIESFALPKHFFTFLDALYPNNAQSIYMTKTKMNGKFADEQLFYAIVKRIRLLLMAKTGKMHKLQEGQRVGGWQQDRIKTQSSRWSIKDLRIFYNELSRLEFGLKTSSLSQKLGEHLDILIFKTLK